MRGALSVIYGHNTSFPSGAVRMSPFSSGHNVDLRSELHSSCWCRLASHWRAHTASLVETFRSFAKGHFQKRVRDRWAVKRRCSPGPRVGGLTTVGSMLAQLRLGTAVRKWANQARQWAALCSWHGGSTWNARRTVLSENHWQRTGLKRARLALRHWRAAEGDLQQKQQPSGRRFGVAVPGLQVIPVEVA